MSKRVLFEQTKLVVPDKPMTEEEKFQNIVKHCIFDDYERTFEKSEENLFKQFLRKVEENTSWKSVKINSLRGIVMVTWGFVGYQEYRDAYPLDAESFSDDLISDTEKHSKMILRYFDEETQRNTFRLLSDTALSGFLERIGANCQSLFKINPKTIIVFLRECAESFSETKEVTLLQRFGKIRACNGGHYPILPITDLYQNVKETFPDAEFDEGYYSHDYFSAKFSFPDREEIVREYKNILISREGKFAKDCAISDVIPYLKVLSSDVAKGSLKICAGLRVGKTSMQIGSLISISHMGNACMDKYKEALSLFFAKTKEFVNELAKLMNIEIQYPINTFISIAKSVKIPSSAISKELAGMEPIYQNFDTSKGDICSAYHIFIALQEASGLILEDDYVGYDRIQEDLLRIMSPFYSWKAHDIPVTLDY